MADNRLEFERALKALCDKYKMGDCDPAIDAALVSQLAENIGNVCQTHEHLVPSVAMVSELLFVSTTLAYLKRIGAGQVRH